MQYNKSKNTNNTNNNTNTIKISNLNQLSPILKTIIIKKSTRYEIHNQNK